MKISVLPVGPFDASFTYLSDENLAVGQIVRVPFGKRNLVGVVTGDPVSNDKIALKSIERSYNYRVPNYDFMEWIASYTVSKRGNVLKMILAEQTLFSTKKSIPAEEMLFNFEHICLNDEQKCAYNALLNNRQTLLLEGVTGSGKTEIYLSYVQQILLQGKQVLILLPEISLTPQIMQRIQKYFGVLPLVWNTSVSAVNRRIAWIKALSGERCIIIGARSALFLPFTNLGCIIVDEEQDSSYKQEEGVLYNARDMAVVLGKLRSVPVVLSSATPSFESYANVLVHKYGYVSVKNRFGTAQLPHINLIDMRQNEFNGYVSPPLIDAIQKRMALKEQTLIYVNRRGYAPISLCKSCGEKISCPNCSTWLVYHKGINKLVCHYCEYSQKIPSSCKYCGSEDSYIQYGVGVERISEELLRKIPNIRLGIASSDTISSIDKIEDLMQQVKDNKIDVIIGTQILAKGHHFPNITLVGIIDGDLGLQGADIRASEKTYQLVNQVAGRAGREGKKGEILIQTYKCNHPLFVALKYNQNQQFIDMEMEFRKEHSFPPFSRLVSIIISGKDKQNVEKVARKIKETCPRNIEIFGPSPAPIPLLRSRVRWRILLRYKGRISHILRQWMSSLKIPRSVRIQIDVDPINFL